jgi:hypothetical protein
MAKMPALPGFRPAGTAEIIRAHQKDDFYLSFLKSTASEVVQSLAGLSIFVDIGLGRTMKAYTCTLKLNY